MRTNLLLLQFVIAGIFSVQLQAQSFQKFFGLDTNRQTLTDIVPGNGTTMYGAGNFMNFELQPQFNIYGTVTKLNTSGGVSWYKGYLPEDALSSEDFFIDSILYASDAIYCFGHFISMETDSGYSLLKLTTNGEIIWAKHYLQNIFGTVLGKAILHGEFIYAILENRIIKINLDGEITNSVKINIEDYILRDISVTPSGQLFTIGDRSHLDLSKIAALKLDLNLQPLNGFTYSHENFHAMAVRPAISGNKVIIGTENSLFCVNDSGEVQWFKTIIAGVTGGNEDSVQKVVEIKPINNTNEYLVLFKKLLSDDLPQEYIMLGKLNDTDDSLSDFKVINEDPFPETPNFSGNALEIDMQNSTYFVAGNLTSRQGFIQQLNYLHQGNYTSTNCGVESSTATLESSTGIEVASFPSELIVITDIQFEDKDFFSINLSNGIQNKYCSTLSTESFSKGVGIYPNPVYNNLFLENIDQEASILITDITGKTVLDKKISENSTIDLSELVKGIYILTISLENGDFQTEKIIKL